MAFRKLISSPTLNEDESERIAQFFNIPQDTFTDDESNEETTEQHSTMDIDPDLFTELPYSDQ